jgi:hypothetical protein
MGRGSSSSTSQKSNEDGASAVVQSVIKKKAGTWEAPKGPSILPLTLNQELATLELEVKRRMELHQFLAERQVDDLKSIVGTALWYLPKEVKNMNVRDYYQKFGGNLNAFADHEKKRVMNVGVSRAVEAATKRRSAARKKISELASARSQKKTNDTINSSANSSSFLNLTAQTVPSTPAQGTAISSSKNLLTVQAKKTPGGNHVTGTPIVTLLLGSSYVEMTENNLGNLDSATKVSAEAQLEKMSAKLQQFQQLLRPDRIRDLN